MSVGHTILISTVHSSSFLWLYSHTLVSSRTFNRGPSRRRTISAGDSYQSGPGVDGGMEENPFHLPSDFHSICSLPPPPLFNPIFLSTAEFSEREHYVRDRSSSPFLKQTHRHVFVFPPLHSFFFSHITARVIRSWVRELNRQQKMDLQCAWERHKFLATDSSGTNFKTILQWC